MSEEGRLKMFEITVREIIQKGDKTSSQQIYQQVLKELDLRSVIDAVNKQEIEIVSEDKKITTLDPLSEINHLKSWCELKGYEVGDIFECNRTFIRWQIEEITTLILIKSLFDGQYKAVTNIRLMDEYTKRDGDV
jgi:hypothetical protein